MIRDVIRLASSLPQPLVPAIPPGSLHLGGKSQIRACRSGGVVGVQWMPISLVKAVAMAKARRVHSTASFPIDPMQQ